MKEGIITGTSQEQSLSRLLAITPFGKLSVRVGNTRTGKTERIIDNAEIAARQTVGAQRNFKRVLLVRPDKGDFKNMNILESHGRDRFDIGAEEYRETENVNVCVLKYSREDELFINHTNHSYYLINEGHLFSEDLALAIEKLIIMGKDVYFTGRHYDSNGIIYPTTKAVMLSSVVHDYKVLYDQRQPRLGKPGFKVRVGSMYSTKTKKIIQKARNSKYGQKLVGGEIIAFPLRILIVRPQKDTRFEDKNVFTTHGNKSFDFGTSEWDHVDIWVVPFGKENNLLSSDHDLILIEEGQFFSPKIAPILAELNEKGMEIYFTGLLHDFQDNVFPTSEAVMSLKEVTNIRKLWAQCNCCQEYTALLSSRLDENDKIIYEGPQEVVGSDVLNTQKIKYVAHCHRCKWGLLGLI